MSINHKTKKIMKNIKYFLLSFLIIVLFPKYSFAQISISIFPSTERSIPNTAINRVMPIKTENWDNDHIISLVHYGSNKYTDGRFIVQGDIYYHKDICDTSVFYLTDINTNTIKTVKISGHTITDFCIVDKYIFMCGQDSANNNLIAYKDINAFFDIAINPTLSIYHLNNLLHPLNNVLFRYTLTNIDFCISAGKPKLLLLANQNNYLQNNYFISYDLLNNDFVMYQADVRLLDIVQTDDYIAVLGAKNDTTFTLTRHEIDNISNCTGKEFYTDPLCHHFIDPKYHLLTLRKDLNHVVVGESVMNTGWMEFNLIDLNIVSTQATIDTREGRSKIMDLEFDEPRGILHCLFCNGFDMRDMIVQIHPYRTQNYSALVSKPQTHRIGYNLLKDITIYNTDNLQFLTLGRIPGLDVYLFDRIFDFNISTTCDEIDSLNIGIVERPNSGAFSCSYYTNFPAYSQQISLYRDSTNYTIICQK